MTTKQEVLDFITPRLKESGYNVEFLELTEKEQERERRQGILIKLKYKGEEYLFNSDQKNLRNLSLYAKNLIETLQGY